MHVLLLQQVVIDILFTAHELISISKDGTVAFWELSTGECTRNLDVSCLTPGANTRLHLSGDGRRLIVDSDAINSPVCIFDMKTLQLLHKYHNCCSVYVAFVIFANFVSLTNDDIFCIMLNQMHKTQQTELLYVTSHYVHVCL